MKKQLNRSFFALIIFFYPLFLASQSLKVEDFRKDKLSDREVIQKAFDALKAQGHGSIEFDGSKTYTIDDCIELPKFNTEVAGRQIFVIKGNGCTIDIKDSKSCGFYRKPDNQKEALNQMMRCRFKIEDFNFVGGAKAIELCATYGSEINNCNFTGQHIAAIDIQFGLNTTLSHCYATNCLKDSFILRTGEDWGGSGNNSQSNHSVLSSCRVYAKKGSSTAFKILGSSGVKLENIISEGSSEIDYAVFADKQNSNTVRLLTIENYHLEHAPKKAAFYFSSTGIVTLDGLFYQISRKGEDFVLVHGNNTTQQITLKNIPHFVGGTVLSQSKSGGGISWELEYCHKHFFNKENWRIKDRKTNEVKKELPYYFSGKGYLYQIDKEY